MLFFCDLARKSNWSGIHKTIRLMFSPVCIICYLEICILLYLILCFYLCFSFCFYFFPIWFNIRIITLYSSPDYNFILFLSYLIMYLLLSYLIIYISMQKFYNNKFQKVSYINLFDMYNIPLLFVFLAFVWMIDWKK